MWRIILIILSVLILDFALFFVGWIGTVDLGMRDAQRAVAAQMDNPTPENRKAVDAAYEKAQLAQFKVRGCFAAVIFVLTAGGFFIAGRQYERRRRLRPAN